MKRRTLITPSQGLQDFKGQCKDLMVLSQKTEETQVAADKSPFRGVSRPWSMPVNAPTPAVSFPLARR